MYVFESFGELHFRPTFHAGPVQRCIAIVKSNAMPIVWLRVSVLENYGHFGPKTLRTLDTSALVWWVRTVRTDRHWCRSVLKTVRTEVPNCLALSAELSRSKCRSVLAPFWRLRTL